MPTFDKRDLLARAPLFSQFSADELSRLVSFMRVERYPARRVLVRKGDPGTSMMVVLEGRVQICTRSEEGREFVVNIINPGEVFGEIALLDGKERTADATAMADCELLVIERREFIPFLERHPEICTRLLAVLCERLRRTSEQVEDVLFLELPARLTKALLRLAASHGRAMAGGQRIELKLSQRELGNMIGTSRETVTRVVKELKQDGWLDQEGKHYLLKGGSEASAGDAL